AIVSKRRSFTPCQRNACIVFISLWVRKNKNEIGNVSEIKYVTVLTICQTRSVKMYEMSWTITDCRSPAFDMDMQRLIQHACWFPLLPLRIP
ncbi:MAG: hypothetical protein LKI04_28905, partial [Paenibacillus lautus]|uniref:hypothetical protein n=1 Tax=Paenibacillus lautus TaxID=1401 RepID=UPI0026EB44A0